MEEASEIPGILRLEKPSSTVKEWQEKVMELKSLTEEKFEEMRKVGQTLSASEPGFKFSLPLVLLPPGLLYNDEPTEDEKLRGAEMQQNYAHCLAYFYFCEKNSENEERARLTYDMIRLQEHIIFILKSTRSYDRLSGIWQGIRTHANIAALFPNVWFPNTSLDEIRQHDLKRGIDGVGLYEGSDKKIIFLFDAKGKMEDVKPGIKYLKPGIKYQESPMESLPPATRVFLRNLGVNGNTIPHLTIHLPYEKLPPLRQVDEKAKNHPYLQAVNRYVTMPTDPANEIYKMIEAVDEYVKLTRDNTRTIDNLIIDKTKIGIIKNKEEKVVFYIA